MRRFIKQISIFAIVFSLFAIFLLAFTSYLANDRVLLLVDSESDKLILGHSRPECAYDDRLISGVKNISDSRESYFYTYLKLKNVLSQNSHIETIFVEFTDNNIPKEIDDWIHGEMEMNSNFIKYAYLTDTKDILAIANENPLGMFKSLPKIVRRNIGYIKTSQNLIDDFGGYYSLSHKLNSSPNHSSENKGEITLSDLNLRYLENIIKLARKSNVDIFLITTPVHEEKNVNSYFKNVLENQFGEVSYLDFSNFKLEVDEYADLQHLNKYGAKRFSLWFNEFLELEKLNQTTADSLIEVANRNQVNLLTN